MLEHITVNYRARKVQEKKLDGIDYLVADAVILVEGVLPGSDGPVYYPAEENAKSYPTWNHRPLVVNHPEINGKPVSACLPEMLEKHKCGLTLNSRWKNKTIVQFWHDLKKLEKMEQLQILEALKKEQMMEVSTGVNIMNLLNLPGEFKGIRYNFRAHDQHGDHVALLPDKIGACPISGGCGLLAINELFDQEHEDSPIVVTHNCSCQEQKMKKEKLVNDLIANEQKVYEEGDRTFLMNKTEDQLEKLLAALKPVVNVDPPTPRGGLTWNELKENAEPMTLDIMNEMEQTYATTRTGLIATITANKSNTWTTEELADMPTAHLRKLAKLAETPAAPAQPRTPRGNFTLSAGVQPTVNVGDDANKPVPPKTGLGVPNLNSVAKNFTTNGRKAVK